MTGSAKLILLIASITVVGVYAASIKVIQAKALKTAIEATAAAQMNRTVDAGVAIGLSRLSQDSLRFGLQNYSRDIFTGSAHPSNLHFTVKEDSARATIELTATLGSAVRLCKANAVRSDIVPSLRVRNRHQLIHYRKWIVTGLYTKTVS